MRRLLWLLTVLSVDVGDGFRTATEDAQAHLDVRRVGSAGVALLPVERRADGVGGADAVAVSDQVFGGNRIGLGLVDRIDLLFRLEDGR